MSTTISWAALEFACALSGAMALVVVGHTNCGAIRGAADDVIYGNLTETLANLKPAVAAVQEFDADRTAANPAFVQAVADKNVELTLQRILVAGPIPGEFDRCRRSHPGRRHVRYPYRRGGVHLEQI